LERWQSLVECSCLESSRPVLRARGFESLPLRWLHNVANSRHIRGDAAPSTTPVSDTGPPMLAAAGALVAVVSGCASSDEEGPESGRGVCTRAAT
jgi:hypothetical protein